jgi:hypothetical protein
MIRSGLILMIREKAKDGKSNYAIGNELGISKNTARKYREPQVQSEVQIKSSSKLDAFKWCPSLLITIQIGLLHESPMVSTC